MLLLPVLLLLGACAAPRTRPVAWNLRLIGVTTLPNKMAYNGTTVGGLSGIDYDAARDEFVSESDDRSDINPARFYSLRVSYDQRSVKGVEVTGVTYFRQPNGETYPNAADVEKRGGEVPDLETIRLDPRDGSIWYASEGGERPGRDPFVRHARRDGSFVAELPRLPQFQFAAKDSGRGPRGNRTFEGLSFDPAGETLWLGMESPLFQDGGLPTVTRGALVRFSHLDRDGHVLGQFAYPVSPIPEPPAEGKLADNGVSEILATPAGTLLVLERSGHQDAEKKWHYAAKLFEASVGRATNVATADSLTAGAIEPMPKRLVVDFATQGQSSVGNLEGVTWGRRLSNGHATLVLVADDNFTLGEAMQFWIFEVISQPTAPFSP
jgi:hypothetical protein